MNTQATTEEHVSKQRIGKRKNRGIVLFSVRAKWL
jgi:hypothetical protein